jgi:hypothetical protein
MIVTFTDQLVLERGRYSQGRVLKSWTSAQDEHVDAICQELDNGQQSPMDKPFEAMGLRFDAPPAQASCRCLIEIYRFAA